MPQNHSKPIATLYQAYRYSEVTPRQLRGNTVIPLSFLPVSSQIHVPLQKSCSLILNSYLVVGFRLRFAYTSPILRL